MSNPANAIPKKAAYYQDCAFRSGQLPVQRDQLQEMNRSRLGRSAGMRLPWGNARDLVPSDILSVASPEVSGRIEKHRDAVKESKFQQELSHECIRYTPLTYLTRSISFLNGLSKIWLLIGVVVFFFMYMLEADLGSHETWLAVLWALWGVALIFLVAPSSLWLLSILMLRVFPRWTVRAGRGPDWELNRRTGMVTIWNYPRKIPLRPRDEPTVTEAPFYEFDGWACGSMDRGGPFFYFVLSHRYQKLEAYFDEFISRCYGRPKEVYGLWDFIQNYMDITKPLPDIPMLEAYRHLDPVTARYDEENGRPERYWRDMDKRIFKKELKEMSRRVWDIDTEQRANLMAEKVRYAT